MRSSVKPVLVYGFGMLAGAEMTGTLLWFVARLARDLIPPMPGKSVVIVAMFALPAVVAIYADATGRRTLLPQRAAQVPRRWAGWPWRSATAFAWGLELGLGVFTYLHYASMYVFAVVLMLAPTYWLVASIVGLYSLGRAWSLLSVWWQPPTGAAKPGFERLSHLPAWLLPAVSSLTLLSTAALALKG